MFSLPVRLILAIFVAAYGFYKVSHGDVLGYLFLAAAIVLLIGYFRYGSVRPAFQAMQRGEYNKARKLIRSIKFPNLLNAPSRAYLHWINAVLAIHSPKDLSSAEREIRFAIAGKLRTLNDRCLAMATLAYIVYQKDDRTLAQSILAEAESIPHKQSASLYLEQLRNEFLNVDQGDDDEAAFD